MRWRIVALLVIAALVAGVAFVCSTGTTPPAWYPRCPLHATTGLLCPGCGSARVLHDLAHGNIRSAGAHNLLIVALIPFLAFWLLAAIWRALRHNLPPPAIPKSVALILIVVIIAFTIARNLPWYPFTLLAP